MIVDNPPPTPSHLSGHDVLNYDTKEDMDPSQSCRTILKTCDETSFIPGLQAGPSGVSYRGGSSGSFLQRGSGQLVGQCVPALHFLALVLQTVYPVLQSLSL